MDILDDLLIRIMGDGRSYETAVNKAIGDTSKLTSEIGKNTSQLQGLTSRLGAFGEQAQGVLAMLAGNLGIGSFLGTIQTAISKAADTESIEIAFKSLIGDAKLAQATLADLRQFAVSTPFELPQILEAAKSMLAYGQSAETIVPTMQRLGDVASALNIPLSSLTYLYGTLKSSGRVMTVDMRQFANRGIPIWLELAKVIGMVGKDTRELTGSQSAQLQQMVSKGKINFDMIEKAFISMTSAGGRFFNMMKDQSASFNGIISNLKDSLGLLLADIGKQIIEGFDLKRILAEVRDFAQSMADAFKGMDPNIKKFLFTLVGVIASVGVVTAAFLSLKAIIIAIGMIISTVGMPFLVIISLITAAVALWVHELGGIGAALDLAKQKATEFWEWLAPIREVLGSLFSTIGEKAREGWEQVKIWATEAWNYINSQFTVNWDEIRDKIVDGILFAEFTIRNFGMVWDYVWKSMKLGAIVALNTVLANFGVIVGSVLFGPLVVLFEAWQLLWKNIAQVVIDALSGISVNIAKFVSELPKLLSGEKNFAQLLLEGFTSNVKFTPNLGVAVKPLKELEAQWRKEWEEADVNIHQSFEDFKKNRVKNIEDVGKIPPDVLNKNKKQNEEIQKQHEKSMTAIQGFDSVLIGSTESLARILAYRDRLRVGQMAAAGAAGAATVVGAQTETVGATATTATAHSGAPAKMEPKVDVKVDNPAEGGETTLSVLKHIRDILVGESKKQRIELAPGGVGGVGGGNPTR